MLTSGNLFGLVLGNGKWSKYPILPNTNFDWFVQIEQIYIAVLYNYEFQVKLKPRKVNATQFLSNNTYLKITEGNLSISDW